MLAGSARHGAEHVLLHVEHVKRPRRRDPLRDLHSMTARPRPDLEHIVA
jgi:hypothetical protein